jgi:DUF4097 and DUF4098 domain-containing protein YvlB
MKALSIIFASVFFASLLGFIITVSVTGANFQDFSMLGFSNIQTDEPYDVEKSFSETYSNIEIDALAARVTVTLSPDDTTRVNYRNTHSRVELIAEVNNDTLIIKERITASVSWGWNWNWGWGWNWNRGWNWSLNNQAVLDIELPANSYDRIAFDLTSGRIDAELPETRDLIVEVTSGNVTLNYNHDEQGGHLRSRTTSGSINITGFTPGTYDIHSTSGNQNISDLAGTGSIRATSGSISADFAGWDGALDINITSGTVNVTAPAGSGAELNLSRTSGAFNYNMDGDSGSMNRSGSAKIGGDNKQNVRVSITSGNASLRTR